MLEMVSHLLSFLRTVILVTVTYAFNNKDLKHFAQLCFVGSFDLISIIYANIQNPLRNFVGLAHSHRVMQGLIQTPGGL